MDSLTEFEEYLGPKVFAAIEKNIRSYKLDITKAEELVRQLEKLLTDKGQVTGKFRRKRDQPNYQHETAVKGIFSDFFDQYQEEMEKVPPKSDIIQALRSAQMGRLANEMAELVRQEEQGAVSNISPENIPSLGTSAAVGGQGKIMGKLPKTPFDLKIQMPYPPTGTEPFPSNQEGLTCASHAIAKAILMIINLCGFDGNQEEIIQTLIKKVQPNLGPRYPKAFHDITIAAYIEEHKTGKKYNVDIRLNVQTDWEPVPHHEYTDQKLEEMKIQRVISENSQGAHALYVKKYKENVGYHCVNSHGTQNQYPIRKDSVYAVDYIQITEVCFIAIQK